jgi:lipopolysaccharide export system permease protein
VDTRHLSVADLSSEIGSLSEAGVDATRFRVDLWMKLATPLGCLILPMIALFFALGGPPHPSTPATLVFSAGIAVTFLLLSGLGASLGYSQTLSPVAAAFVPTALLSGVAAVLGRRLPILR